MRNAIDAVKNRLSQYSTEAIESVIREIGGGWVADEYRRMVRACAYDVIEQRHGIDRVDAIMAAVDPSWGADADRLLVARAAVRAAFATAGLDADVEIDGFDTMTAGQLADEITYLGDYQG